MDLAVENGWCDSLWKRWWVNLREWWHRRCQGAAAGLGNPMDPEEFLERAVAAGHPASFGSYLPETLRRCISRSLGMTASERVAARASAWSLAKEVPRLRTVETEIHAKLDSGVEEVVRGKRDLGVVDEFCSGATLTGPTCPTGLWPKQFTPATLTEDELQQQATVQRRHLTYSQVVFFGEEIARSVETNTGWGGEGRAGRTTGTGWHPAERAAQQAFWRGARWESPLCGRIFQLLEWMRQPSRWKAQSHTLWTWLREWFPCTVMKFDVQERSGTFEASIWRAHTDSVLCTPSHRSLPWSQWETPQRRPWRHSALKPPPIGQREVGAVLFESGTQHLDNPDHHLSDNHSKLFWWLHISCNGSRITISWLHGESCATDVGLEIRWGWPKGTAILPQGYCIGCWGRCQQVASGLYSDRQHEKRTTELSEQLQDLSTQVVCPGKKLWDERHLLQDNFW